MGMVRVIRLSNRPAANAPFPSREQPVTPTRLESISGTVAINASSVRWKPQAQAARAPILRGRGDWLVLIPLGIEYHLEAGQYNTAQHKVRLDRRNSNS